MKKSNNSNRERKAERKKERKRKNNKRNLIQLRSETIGECPLEMLAAVDRSLIVWEAKKWNREMSFPPRRHPTDIR